MTEYHKKQFTEYLIREVSRRIVPMALEATGDAGCIQHVVKLRRLADDASMTDVYRTCASASADAYAAHYTARDDARVAFADSAHAAARVAAANAYAANAVVNAIFDSAYYADYPAVYSAAAIVGDYVTDYAVILIEAAKLLPSDSVPIIPDLHHKMYDAVTRPGQSLKMRSWHTCATTHCRAGWATVLGGEKGQALENAFGTAIAGGLIYAINTGGVPDFYVQDDVAVMASIKAMAEAS